MEERKKIDLSGSSIFYLIRHFHQIDQTCFDELLNLGYSKVEIEDKLLTTGSKFDAKYVSNPREVLTILNNCAPHQVIEQVNNRTAYIYRFEKSIGWDSIIDVNQIPSENLAEIQEEKRGNQIVRTIELSNFPETNQIVAIVDSETNQVITLFPGCYAPPFPSSDQTKNDYEQSSRFWDSHIFIKRFTNE